MDPRIVFTAVLGIGFDLLCLAAAGIVLLVGNPWLDAVGPARLLFVAMLVGIVLVPLMYAVECQAAARRCTARPERVAAGSPAWSGGERSVHAA